MFKIRVLGYGFDCGVIRISSENEADRDVAIFATSSITTHILISDTLAVLVAQNGEFVHVDCETGTVKLRARPFQHNNRQMKLHFNKSKNEIYCIKDRGQILIVDSDTLQPKAEFNVGQREEMGRYKLFNFYDVEEKFKILAEKERADRHAIWLAAEKAGEEPVYPEEKWSKMHRLNTWTQNNGEYCRFEFDSHLSVLKDNGEIVMPFGGSKKVTAISGVATLSITTKKITLLEYPKTSKDNRHKHAHVRAISPDGRHIIRDHIGFEKPLPPPEMNTVFAKPKKGVFGRLLKRKSDTRHPRYSCPLEIWNIEGSPTLEKIISTGEYDFRDLYIGVRSDWTLPNDWYDDTRRQRLNKSLLAAAELQFENVVEKLEWSEDAFQNAIVKEMNHQNVDMNDIVNQSRVKNKALSFVNITHNRYVFIALLAFIQKTAPDFFQSWEMKGQTTSQQKIFGSIKRQFEFHLLHNLAVCWGRSSDEIYVMLRSGHLRTIDTSGSGYQTVAKIDPFPKPTRAWNDHDSGIVLVRDGVQRLTFTYSTALLEILKTGTEFIVKLIYDQPALENEQKLAEKLARKIRRGYIPIKSKSVRNIVTGLEKLTKEFVKYPDEIVIGNRWDPGLILRGSLVDEYEIAKFLISEDAIESIPVLENFVTAIMNEQISQQRDRNVKNDTNYIATWKVWHNNNEGHIGAPSITALIRLSRSVGPLALKFIRQRDIDHDVYIYEALAEEILPHLPITAEGVLQLISIVALQTLATGNIVNDIFAASGMKYVKDALISGQLQTDSFASMLINEAKALNGELSWASKNGPEGLIAQVVYGLDRSDTWQDKLGLELLKQYPKSKDFLETVE